MQSFGPPNERPRRGLVESRIETYGGQHRASAQNAGSHLYARRGLMLVSPGRAPKVTWVGQMEGCPGFQVSAFYRFVGCSIPIPPPTFSPGLGKIEEGSAGPGSQNSTPIPDRWDTRGREPGVPGPQRRCCQTGPSHGAGELRQALGMAPPRLPLLLGGACGL